MSDRLHYVFRDETSGKWRVVFAGVTIKWDFDTEDAALAYQGQVLAEKPARGTK